MNSIKCENDNAALELQRAIWINDRDTIGNLLKETAAPLSTIALRDKIESFEEVPENLTKICNSIGQPDLINYSINTGSSEDWPLLFVSQPTIDISNAPGENEDEDIGAGWGDDDDIDLGPTSTNNGITKADDEKNDGADINE